MPGFSSARSDAPGNASGKFATRALKALRDEGLQIRRILRIYPPLDTGESSEVLFVSYDGKPGTAWIGPDAELVRGPVKGFGE